MASSFKVRTFGVPAGVRGEGRGICFILGNQTKQKYAETAALDFVARL